MRIINNLNTMKILHTSDWHLGHVLYNESQEEAQKNMLDQLADIVAEHQPDALIIAGDVYDTTQPSASVQQLFANALVKIHEACRDMSIVCIAGNHDSGSKHMIYHTPWHAMNVHMVGSILKESHLDDYIINVPGKGYIVAVPFAAERYMPENVFTTLSAKVKELNSDNLPVALAAHLAVKGSDWRGHEFSSDTNVGGLNCLDLSLFGNEYDYVALGHIHKQQSLDKEKRIWYSGTPIAVSFDESYSGNDHGILLANCAHHGADVSVTPIQINNINPLVNLPIDGPKDWETVREEFVKYDADIASFVRLNIEVENYLPAGANQEAFCIAEGKKCRLCCVNTKRKEKTEVETKQKKFTASELKELDFMEVARMYIEAKSGTFDDEMEQMLLEVKESLQTQNH